MPSRSFILLSALVGGLSGACQSPAPATSCSVNDHCPVGYKCDPVHRFCVYLDGAVAAGDGGVSADAAADAAIADAAVADGALADSARQDSRPGDSVRPDASGADHHPLLDSTSATDHATAVDGSAPDQSSVVDAATVADAGTMDRGYLPCTGYGSCDAGFACIDDPVCLGGWCRGTPSLTCSSCDTTCGSGACCTSSCTPVTFKSTCACGAGQVCVADCQDTYSCEMTCAAWSECSIAATYLQDAMGMNFSYMYCQDSASCFMRCGPENRCYLMCSDTASCMLDCSATTDTCMLSRYEMQPQACTGVVFCANDIQVCHRACP